MDALKYVYTFGGEYTEGNSSMRELLGGKGANLAEMNLIGVPVPPGFTVTTEACNNYYKIGKEKTIGVLTDQVAKGVAVVEKITGRKLGDPNNPLLLSVRSGARASMPGMMDTVLNLGMNDKVVEGFGKQSNEWAAWDSYRRFIQMYGDVVMGLKPESKDDIDPFEKILDYVKEERGIKNDTEFTVDDLKLICNTFRERSRKKPARNFLRILGNNCGALSQPCLTAG